jgi:hypothetical protein
MEDVDDRLGQLYAQVAIEDNVEKLLQLVTEINRLVEEKQQRLGRSADVKQSI